MTRAYFGVYEPGDARILDTYNRLAACEYPIVAVDTETKSLADTTLLGVGFATPDGHSFFFDAGEATLPWWVLAAPNIRKLFHNAAFDLSREVLGKFGADVDNIEDSSIITRLLCVPTELTLAAEALELPHRTSSVQQLF